MESNDEGIRENTKMKIEKDRERAGWWIARTTIGKELFIACSDNKLDALDRLFRKLEWAEVGNWKLV